MEVLARVSTTLDTARRSLRLRERMRARAWKDTMSDLPLAPVSTTCTSLDQRVMTSEHPALELNRRKEADRAALDTWSSLSTRAYRGA